MIKSSLCAALLALAAATVQEVAAKPVSVIADADTLVRRYTLTNDNSFPRAYDGPLLSDDPGPWSGAFAKAQALVSQMTIEERANISRGYSGACVGFTGSVPRLNFTSICLQDGPLGVRPARRVSQFPAGITASATWDRALVKQRATAIAEEFHDKGVNMMLGPVTGGPIGRSVRGGRNSEGFSPDPYLNGILSYDSVRAIQDVGVMACAKHWIGNEQETFRNPYNLTEPYAVFPPLEQDPISSNMDLRTQHEIYMAPFAEAVRAGASSVMCSYNQINNGQSCQDSYEMNELLKSELGFKGFVVSDWGGTHSDSLSAVSGLDVSMPGSAYNRQFGTFYSELAEMVRNGTIPEKRLDDMALRTLTAWFHLQDPATYPQPSFDVRDLSKPTNNVRRDHYKVIQQMGEESITLLKNKAGNGLGLPLPQEMQAVLVAGDDAGSNPVGWTSCGQTGSCEINAPNGTLTSVGGSGWAFPPYTISPLAAIQSYARDKSFDVNIHLDNWNLTNARVQAAVSTASLVFVNAYATEGRDRQNLTLWGNGDNLIQAVASQSNNTIVIIHAPGPVLVESFADHPNVTAILHAYLPGQESGNALPPVLWGEKSPSGKLPFVMGKQLSDWPAPIVDTPVKDPQDPFTEGLFVDYKWFQKHGIAPRYPFGHGLTYSDFEISAFDVVPSFKADNDSVIPTREKYEGYEQGQSFYDQVFLAKATVTNNGTARAAEVAQLYLTFPEAENEPPYVLRGFEKVWLDAGKSAQVSLPLRRKDLMVFDESIGQGGAWRKPKGEVKLTIGCSSERFFGNKTITV